MRRLSVFNLVSLDGYFTDAHGDMSWAHRADPEWLEFVAGNASNAGATLLYGRVTYELMASFWPTAQARNAAPEVAQRMNAYSKVVFSRTLTEPTWVNTRLVKTDPVDEVRALKRGKGTDDLVVMGSGTIVAQLAEAGLVDEFQVVVCPLVLGAGRTMFEGVKHRLPLTLVKSRQFKNGNVVLWYAPA